MEQVGEAGAKRAQNVGAHEACAHHDAVGARGGCVALKKVNLEGERGWGSRQGEGEGFKAGACAHHNAIGARCVALQKVNLEGGKVCGRGGARQMGFEAQARADYDTNSTVRLRGSEGSGPVQGNARKARGHET